MSPVYLIKHGQYETIENKMYVQKFSENIQQVTQEFYQTKNLNTQSTDDLFRGYIDYYFNGGGFDHIHDVIDTRLGKIVKLKDIPNKFKDPINGIDTRVRKDLRQSIFKILEPFDYNYVPSKAFSLNYKYKHMMHMMAKFIEPEFVPKSNFSKKPWYD